MKSKIIASWKITAALIGFGYWGPNYARLMSASDDINFKWICDLDKSLLKKASKDFPAVKLTCDYQEILKDFKVDAVVIATPTITHTKIIADSLNYGKHVLVEKPLSVSSKECERLINFSIKKKVILMVGQTYFFNPSINYLKKIIEKNALGDILYFSAQRTNLGPIRSDVNAMWDLAPHDISNILYLSDSKPTDVSVSGSSYLNKNHPDIVNLSIWLEKNIFSNILVSWLAPIKIRNLTIVGDSKMAVFDDTDLTNPIRIFQKQVIELKKGQLIPFSQFKNLSLYHGKIETPPIVSKEPLKAELANFINSILKKEKPLVSHKHALSVVRVLEAAQKSLKNKKVIHIH